MILADTGPLVALLNRKDVHHDVCVAALERLPETGLRTTWPCFVEAMYLLGRAGGYSFQAALWRVRAEGDLVLHDMSAAEIDRAESLMRTYADSPMDLADASLLAAAEELRATTLLTVDGHFRYFRMRDGSVLNLVP